MSILELVTQAVVAFIAGYYTVKVLHWAFFAHMKDEDKPWH